MLSKQQISFVRSLHQKKFRQMYGKFLVEGDKPVRELLSSGFKVHTVFAVDSWPLAVHIKKANLITVSEEELRKISTLENPKEVVAVVEIPNYQSFRIDNDLQGLTIVCDNLNDPGNAGTIIRIADWFGIKQVFFSENSVDIYNPKVVNAAKGSLFRVNCIYTNLRQLFAANSSVPVYGTVLDGQNIYEADLPTKAFILIGNEANGIGEDLFPFMTHHISIPKFGKAESLNAGVATGIVVSEFMRRQK
jgi:TrmH family RNA methyltransferase